jgi:dTDP-4-dehydrorhamnose reductase
MAIDPILAQIDAEIARLTQARALLANLGTASVAISVPKAAASPVAAKRKKKRVLSPEARKRIADAQRKRWAAQKSKVKGK